MLRLNSKEALLPVVPFFVNIKSSLRPLKQFPVRKVFAMFLVLSFVSLDVAWASAAHLETKQDPVQQVSLVQMQNQQAALKNHVAGMTAQASAMQDMHQLHAQMQMPHPNEPEKHQEHMAALNLVKHSEATHVVTKSGNWSDASIWDGALPGENARIVIAEGVTVTVDDVFNESIWWLRVDGTLQFATDKDTGLKVDTVVVDPKGAFLMGTADNPIGADYEAKLIFADRGEIDTDWDPRMLSRGLISHGKTRIHGAEKTAYVEVNNLKRRDTEIVLDTVPTGWQVGDQLVLTSERHGYQEELILVGIEGNKLTIFNPETSNGGLKRDRRVEFEGASFHLANISRNAVLESEAAHNLDALGQYDIDRAGHVMFMHTRDVDVRFAASYANGRTDKERPLENPDLDENGKFIPQEGMNVAGRYSWHFHRNGVDLDVNPDPAVMFGNVAVGSPGWGYVNHSSYVHMEQNVSYDVLGAHFVGEAGDEIGIMKDNLAIHSAGSGVRLTAFTDDASIDPGEASFGHQGHGYWLQGGGIELDGNIAVGHRNAAFIVFSQGLEQEGDLGTTKFLAKNLRTSFGSGEHVSVSNVPFVARNLVAYGVRRAFETWFHRPRGENSVIEDSLFWHNGWWNPVFTPYTSNLTIRNTEMYAPHYMGQAYTPNHATSDIRFENLTLKGFVTGIRVPQKGHNVILGGVFDNLSNIFLTNARNINRVVDIQDGANGPIQFLTERSDRLYGREVWNINASWSPRVRHNRQYLLFEPDRVRLGTVLYGNKQFYFFEQASDFVLKNTGLEELDGKTHQQIYDEYGLMLGGAIAPEGAVQVDGVRGVLGEPATYIADKARLYARRYYNQDRHGDYTLRYRIKEGNHYRYISEQDKIHLPKEGWNLITRDIEIDGQPVKKTFFVYKDTIAPTYRFTTKDFTIHPSDLKKGFDLRGTIMDDSWGGSMMGDRRFRNLQDKVGPDGTIDLEFDIHDWAGNKATVSFRLTVSSEVKTKKQRLPNWRPKSRPRVRTFALSNLLGFRFLRRSLLSQHLSLAELLRKRLL